MKLLVLSIVFVYGVLIGSFLNVCIYRIPKKESITWTRSHCMGCGYQLAWFDNIPLISYLFLKGRCRKCHQRISLQYPLIEALNAILYVMVFLINGMNVVSVLYCFATSALIVLSVIDWKTFEIPMGLNIFLGILGVIRVIFDYTNWYSYVIGFFVVSGFLFLLFLITSGRGIGFGDIKLMAASGLLLGWKLIILSLFVGCILGSIIHVIRMKVSKADHILAFGPYLALGIYLSMLFGNQFWNWYLAFGM